MKDFAFIRDHPGIIRGQKPVAPGWGGGHQHTGGSAGGQNAEPSALVPQKDTSRPSWAARAALV